MKYNQSPKEWYRMIMSYVIRLHIWEELFHRFLTPLNIITTDEVGHFIIWLPNVLTCFRELIDSWAIVV